MSHINVTHVKQMCKLSLCKTFRNKIYSNIHCETLRKLSVNICFA